MQNPPLVSRIHHSWLAASEKRLLVRLAASLPVCVTPDHLTMGGIAGAMLCGLGYAASARSPLFLWLAVLGLLINWLGDSLDGSLARHRGTERHRYGFFIDHTTDILSQVFIFFGIGASPYMRLDIAFLALLSYWMAALLTFIRAVATQVFQISYFGIGPTEIRLGLIGYTLVLLAAGPMDFLTPIGVISPISVIIVGIAVGVFVSFVHMVWAEGHRLAALERIPAQAQAQEGIRTAGGAVLWIETLQRG
jgi:phosphatidylglycerophosphate synthase